MRIRFNVQSVHVAILFAVLKLRTVMRFKTRDWVRACVWAVLAVSMLLEDFTVAEEGTDSTVQQ